jgi:hypothetical protein
MSPNGPEGDSGKTRDQVGELVGVSGKSIARATKPELVKAERGCYVAVTCPGVQVDRRRCAATREPKILAAGPPAKRPAASSERDVGSIRPATRYFNVIS